MNTILHLHGTSVEISREGVQTVRSTHYADSFQGIDNVPKTWLGFGGEMLKLVNLSAGQAEEGSRYIVVATYEGIAPESFVNKTYSWEPEQSQDPIETNINFDAIVAKYGGQESEPGSGTFDVWPDIKSGKKGATTKSPMVGVRSFLELGGVWVETEVLEEIPEELWNDMWSIVDSVPGGLPPVPNRYWLVLPPKIEQRGACYTIARSWKLTGEMTDAKLELARMIYLPISGGGGSSGGLGANHGKVKGNTGGLR